MASVDVVVPCYNYAHYLEKCIASITSQRDVDVRVLIVDDCSPDNTPEVASRLAAADPRITYVRNPVNLGLIGTANRGVMDWASADYVVLISADDLLTPGALARAAQLMDAHPEIAMTYGLALMMSDEGAPLTPPDVRDAATRIVPGKRFIQEVCAQGNFVPTPCAVMRTSVQHRIGGYDPRFKHTSDIDTWLRAATEGPIGVVNAIQGLYRWHASNMSAAFQRRPIGDRREMIETCRAFLNRYGDKAPEAAAWVEAMERRYGEEAVLVASKSFTSPGDDTWEDSLSFAVQHFPDYRGASTWRTFQVKRALGRKLSTMLQRLADGLRTLAARPPGPAWYDHGERYGWWPENLPAGG